MTSPKLTLRLAAEAMQAKPKLHIDQALINVLKMPADATEWTHKDERAYCAAVEYLRSFLPMWSVTGFSQAVSDRSRYEVLWKASA